MSLVLAFDSGPLGQLSHPDINRYPDLFRWFAAHHIAGTEFIFLEISDFEVRRNLIVDRRRRALRRLNDIISFGRYLPITTSAMRLAAVLWANQRRVGRSVGDPKELNADVIVAAQSVQAKAILVTDNPKHFPVRLATSHWSAIKPPESNLTSSL
jgi:predicted nucleic acid-binding protein